MENFANVGFKLSVIIPAVILIVGIIMLLMKKILDYYSLDGLGILALLLIPISFIVLAFTAFPYHSPYVNLYEVEGTVTSVSSAMTDDHGELTKTPVLSLDTVNTPITMNDPRAVELNGKDVKLLCTVDWNYRAADSYDCKLQSVN